MILPGSLIPSDKYILKNLTFMVRISTRVVTSPRWSNSLQRSIICQILYKDQRKFILCRKIKYLSAFYFLMKVLCHKPVFPNLFTSLSNFSTVNSLRTCSTGTGITQVSEIVSLPALSNFQWKSCPLTCCTTSSRWVVWSSKRI